MIYLALSILTSALIYVVFKLFERFQIDNFQAIVANYFTASTLGFLLTAEGHHPLEVHQHAWLPSVIILGFLFITLFNVMALVSQKISISVASVANKMSVVIPVIMAVLLFEDTMNWIKVVGIILALVAIHLTTVRKEKTKSTDRRHIWLPILLFAGSGLLDSLLKYNQHHLIEEGDLGFFTSSIFGMAAVMGTITLLFKKEKLKLKNIIGGIALGIPNFGSIYFLLHTLNIKGIESSAIFPINNMGVVGLSAIFALVIFREKLSMKNTIGIILAIVAIGLIAYA